MSTATICQALPTQINQAKAKAQSEHTVKDWELVSEASLDLNSEDDEATTSLWKKVKEDHMAVRTAERRQKCEEERKEEEETWRAEEAKKEAKEAEKVAEVQRRAADRQHKLSMIIPAGGSTCRSASGPSLGTRAPCDRCASRRPPLKCKPGAAKGKSTTCEPCHKAKASCSWSKAAGGAMQKRRRMEAKENNDEDDEEDDEDDGKEDFVVLPALTQEHRDALSALMTTLSALLKEFKGYCHEQWDLQARQVRGLKALQREMKKANTLKAKELEATTKGKEKAVEVLEESLESGNEGEQIEGEGSEGGEAVEVCHLSTNVILSRVWPPRRVNKKENGVQ
ncbi:hypothetical protein ID866_10554 [Astraeus odoratus]|nr:hypothetical protein ID866_10554 [Astraeus odoratus]